MLTKWLMTTMLFLGIVTTANAASPTVSIANVKVWQSGYTGIYGYVSPSRSTLEWQLWRNGVYYDPGIDHLFQASGFAWSCMLGDLPSGSYTLHVAWVGDLGVPGEFYAIEYFTVP